MVSQDNRTLQPLAHLAGTLKSVAFSSAGVACFTRLTCATGNYQVSVWLTSAHTQKSKPDVKSHGGWYVHREPAVHMDSACIVMNTGEAQQLLHCSPPCSTSQLSISSGSRLLNKPISSQSGCRAHHALKVGILQQHMLVHKDCVAMMHATDL